MLTPAQETWLQALESGDYQQARGRLEVAGAFCCLGVACVVAEKAGVTVEHKDGIVYGGTLSAQYPVLDWLGLRSHNGASGTGTLVALNDHGASFKEIAQTVRANPDLYFFPEVPDVDACTGVVAQGS